MAINWNLVAEFVIGGLILAMSAGVGALAFRDWSAFRRLFFRVLVVTGTIGLISLLVIGAWTDINVSSIADEIESLVALGTELPGNIVETIEFNQKLRNYRIYWVGVPVGGIWLYMLTLYLFARPVPGASELKRQKLKKKQSEMKFINTRIAKLEKELEAERVKLFELQQLPNDKQKQESSDSGNVREPAVKP